MPEHMPLLISEAGAVKPAKVIQVFKQRVSRRMRAKRGCGDSGSDGILI